MLRSMIVRATLALLCLQSSTARNRADPTTSPVTGKPTVSGGEPMSPLSREDGQRVVGPPERPRPRGAQQAAIYLGQIGPDAAAALPNLGELLSDQRLEIRIAALHTLVSLKGEAKAAVAAIIQQSAKEWSARLKIRTLTFKEAAIYLGQLGPAAAVALPNLGELLSDKRLEIRLAALEVLTRMEGEAKAAVPALIQLSVKEWSGRLKDPTPRCVRKRLSIWGRSARRPRSLCPILPTSSLTTGETYGWPP